MYSQPFSPQHEILTHADRRAPAHTEAITALHAPNRIAQSLEVQPDILSTCEAHFFFDFQAMYSVIWQLPIAAVFTRTSTSEPALMVLVVADKVSTRLPVTEKLVPAPIVVRAVALPLM